MAKEPNQKVITKKHLARLEKERLQQRYLMIGSIVVIILVIAIVGYGILDQTIIKNQRRGSVGLELLRPIVGEPNTPGHREACSSRAMGSTPSVQELGRKATAARVPTTASDPHAAQGGGQHANCPPGSLRRAVDKCRTR